MAAPAVTRPPATLSHDAVHAYDKWIPVAKWAVLVTAGAAAIGVIVLIAGLIRTSAHDARVKAEWDTLEAALKEKVKPDDRIAALEGVVDKINGTPAHAQALMELGGLYFDKAVDPKAKPEDRGSALDKATKLYQLVLTNYKDNPAFGPLALSSLAACYEQADDYDAAIKSLKDNLTGEMEKHFLFFKMQEQLGRLYWLRALKETDAAKAEQDRKDAYDLLHVVAAQPASKEETDKAAATAWQDEAKYIEALLEKPGKLLPGGVIPPEKNAASTALASVTATAVAPKGAQK